MEKREVWPKNVAVLPATSQTGYCQTALEAVTKRPGSQAHKQSSPPVFISLSCRQMHQLFEKNNPEND